MYRQRQIWRTTTTRARNKYVAMLGCIPMMMLLTMIWTRSNERSSNIINRSFPAVVVVHAQPHKTYRTCALYENEPVYLYYNSSMGMYVRFNNETNRRNFRKLSSTDDNDRYNSENRNLQQERIRMNNDNIMSKYINQEKNSNVTLNQNGASVENSILEPQQQQQQRLRSRWYHYFMSQFLSTTNDDESRPEPAIMMVNHPWDGSSSVSLLVGVGEQEHRKQAVVLETTSSSNRNRGDGDRIRNIDPNIELYQPYDGRIVSVKICHCSDRNTNFNTNVDFELSNYTYYCPVHKSYCYVPVRSKATKLSIYETYPYYYHPLCIPADNPGKYFARNLKLIGCAAFALITIILIVSPTGHHAIRCCCSTFNPGCFHYNQKYINHMIQNDPKLTKYYLERYMNDKDRLERFNRRYIELQCLHGEAVVDENVTPDENRHDPNAATTTSTSSKTSTGTLTPLNEFEKSIVRDMYYYRPSLLLKTRIFNGSSISPEQIPQTVTTIPSMNTSDNISMGRVSQCPYDADILIQCSTDATENMNINSDTSSCSPQRRKDDGCMICFNSIEIGSKVGVLPNCQHVFHTQCLKDWLKRRNVCPLCLDTDVATVAFSRKNELNSIETPPPSIVADDS